MLVWYADRPTSTRFSRRRRVGENGAAGRAGCSAAYLQSQGRRQGGKRGQSQQQGRPYTVVVAHGRWWCGVVCCLGGLVAVETRPRPSFRSVLGIHVVLLWQTVRVWVEPLPLVWWWRSGRDRAGFPAARSRRDHLTPRADGRKLRMRTYAHVRTHTHTHTHTQTRADTILLGFIYLFFF